MLNFQQFIFIGRFTREPELGHTKANKAYCRFTIACKGGWSKTVDAAFFDCVAWDKTAENIAAYFKKGDPILIHDGYFETRSYTDKKSGEKRTKLQLTVRRFQFVKPKGEKVEDEPEGGEPL